MKRALTVVLLALIPAFVFTPLLAQELEFALPITVSDGENSKVLTVGVSPNGSNTATVIGLDQLAPPLPPSPSAFDARILVNDTAYFTKYFDNAITEKTARFEHNASTGNGPITLSWDQETLNILGTFIIKDTFTGGILNQSMNELDGSYTIDGTGLFKDAFNLVFTPSGTLPVTPQHTATIAATTSHYRLLSSVNSNTTLRTLLQNNNIFTQCFPGADRPGCTGTPATSNVYYYQTPDDEDAIWVAADSIGQVVPLGSSVLVYMFENDNQSPSEPGFPSSITSEGMAPFIADIKPTINQNAEGFSLVGNPYGSTIDSDEFIYNDVYPVVWVYDHEFDGPFEEGDDADATNTTAGGWRTWNGTAGSLTNGLLSTFQGFFVQTQPSQSTSSLTIPATSRTSETANLYSTEQPNPALRIAARINQASVSDFWLSFGEDGSLQRSHKDAIALSPLDYADYLMMYTIVDDTPVSTKNLPFNVSTGMEMPLYIDAWEAIEGQQTFAPATGTVELRWDHIETLPSTMQVFLQDHETGSVIDMRTQNEYAFSMVDDGKQRETLAYSKQIRAHNLKDLEDARFSLVFNELPTSINPESEFPTVVALHQNYPNPFNPTTQIAFDVPSMQSVTLSVFDITGRKVAEIANGNYPAGTHTIRFDATSLSSGMYFYKLSTQDQTFTRSMLLLK